MRVYPVPLPKWPKYRFLGNVGIVAGKAGVKQHPPPMTPTPTKSSQASSHCAVSVKTAAGMLEVSEKSIRRLISRGLLKPSRVLRVLRIPVDQIASLLKN